MHLWLRGLVLFARHLLRSQATELMQLWEPIDVEDALRLLSPDFTHTSVREFAVSILSVAREEDIVAYLLQLVPCPVVVRPRALRAPGRAVRACSLSLSLSPPGVACRQVQALRYETMVPDDAPAAESRHRLSPLADFLVDRAVRRYVVACFVGESGRGRGLEEGGGWETRRCRFLCWFVDSASVCPVSVEIANYLNWYLMVEVEDKRHGGMFSRVHGFLVSQLMSYVRCNPRCLL